MTQYDRVAQSLRERILSGRFRRGQKLPTEHQLCEQLGTSRITVRRALDILSQELLLERRQGAGTFVTAASQRKIPILNTDFCGSVARHAPELARRLERWGWRRASEKTARLLHISPRDQVLHAISVDELRGIPAAVDEVVLPARFADRLSEQDLGQIDFLRCWKKVQRFAPDRCVQTIEATAARPPMCRRLRVRRGAPLLREANLFYAPGDQPAGLIVSFYRHDCFRFDATIPLNP